MFHAPPTRMPLCACGSRCACRPLQNVARAGYATAIFGKTDWTTGAHSASVYLSAWTMAVRFPYDVADGGWHDETDDCHTSGAVDASRARERHADWADVNASTAWVRGASAGGAARAPWFAYQGMTIVHPPYATNAYWLERVDAGAVRAPAWAALEDLHPCDLQSSMLKGCLPQPDEGVAPAFFYSRARRRRVRRIYAAMIAEFDAMVGAHLANLDALGLARSAVVIVTSDHGDMQMEHQQHYKMVPYDASSRVPLIIAAPGVAAAPRVVDAPAQLIDLFPTILELAGVANNASLAARLALDGHSLAPLLARADGVDDARPDYVTSQFHGDNIAMSWFLVRRGDLKYVAWGDGTNAAAAPPMLFDLRADPDENTNLAADPAFAAEVAALDAALRTEIDYPRVAREVALYNWEQMHGWINRTGANWTAAIRDPSLRWSASWEKDPDGAMAALEAWLAQPPAPVACRGDLVFPRPS